MTKNEIFVRITDVHASSNGDLLVSYYAGDVERQIVWQAAKPSVGDVFRLDAACPDKARRISGPVEGAWSHDSDALRWRKPLAVDGISRMAVLQKRHLIKQAVRSFLDQQGFIEIDSPLLVGGTTPDMAVESFPVEGRYLVTSTEYQMKRLAVGGFEKIYSLTQNFRPGDEGTYRNPEFTMLEWGRVGEDMRVIEADTEAMTIKALDLLGLPDVISYQGRKINMRAPWQRLSVAEAVHQLTGVAIDDFEAASCRKAVEAAGLEVREAWAEDRDFLFSLLMDHLQPRLGAERPVFLCDWPQYQTTSAALDEDKKTAERSELYIAGIEISDGFAAMADAALQETYFNYALSKRQSEGQVVVDLDQKYMAAMRLGAPYGAGMALGFDRLVMLLTDQPAIRNVLAFAWDEL